MWWRLLWLGAKVSDYFDNVYPPSLLSHQVEAVRGTNWGHPPLLHARQDQQSERWETTWADVSYFLVPGYPVADDHPPSLLAIGHGTFVCSLQKKIKKLCLWESIWPTCLLRQLHPGGVLASGTNRPGLGWKTFKIKLFESCLLPIFLGKWYLRVDFCL